MRLGEEMDYSQGLPTPMGQIFDDPLGIKGFKKDFSDTLKDTIIPIALVALGVVVLASFWQSSQVDRMAGLGAVRRRGKKKLKISKKAQTFISKKIATIMHEKPSRSQKQAIRIAFEMAREQGFRVPSVPRG